MKTIQFLLLAFFIVFSFAKKTFQNPDATLQAAFKADPVAQAIGGTLSSCKCGGGIADYTYYACNANGGNWQAVVWCWQTWQVWTNCALGSYPYCNGDMVQASTSLAGMNVTQYCSTTFTPNIAFVLAC